MSANTSFDVFIVIACMAILYCAYRVSAVYIKKSNESVRRGSTPGVLLTSSEIKRFALGMAVCVSFPILLVLYVYRILRINGAASVFPTFLRAIDMSLMVVIFCAAVLWPTVKCVTVVFKALFTKWLTNRSSAKEPIIDSPAISRPGRPSLIDLVGLLVFLLLFVAIGSGMSFLLTRPIVSLLLYGSYDSEPYVRGLSDVFQHVSQTATSWGISQVLGEILAAMVSAAPVIGAFAAIIAIVKNSLDILDRIQHRRP